MLVTAPKMPAKINAIIHEEWELLDSEAPRLLQYIKDARVFHQFAHARDTFVSHLRGTWHMLEAWEQPQPICRCGLLHSAFTRDGFYFRYFDIGDPASRLQLSGVVGADAEALIYNYCVSESLWEHGEFGGNAVEWQPHKVQLGEPLRPEGYDMPTREDPSQTVHFSAEQVAAHFVVFVADVAEQMTDVMSYVDVYHEISPARLWPGTGVPGIGFAFFSRMLRTAAPHLEVIPPVFNGCTEVLDLKDEVQARECYWRGVQGEGKLPR